MPAQTILELGNPILWERSTPIEEPTSASTSELLHDLEDTLEAFREANGFGRGISAPQIGVLKRAVFVHLRPAGFRGAMINPEITFESAEQIEEWDGCFSYRHFLVRVSRAASIRVEYLDEQGQIQALEATGELAALLQHEIDHLDGILAIGKAISPQSFITREEWERQGRPF